VREYVTPGELREEAIRYFSATGGWVYDGNFEEYCRSLAFRKGSHPELVVPIGWVTWAGFGSYQDFLDVKHRGEEWGEVVGWVDNVLRKCAETALMEGDRKNNRGPEILVGTFWGYSAKQIVDFRDGINRIAVAAMQELAAKIPMDDRDAAIARFQAAVHAATGVK